MVHVFVQHRRDQLRIQQQDIVDSARLQGIKTIDEIEYAIVERNGELASSRTDVNNGVKLPETRSTVGDVDSYREIFLS